MQRHRRQELIRFLNAIEAEVPAGKLVHVILDNHATHKHLKVRAWLKRHPRFVFHFTPTSSSWLNAVEGYFAKLTRRRLKRIGKRVHFLAIGCDRAEQRPVLAKRHNQQGVDAAEFDKAPILRKFAVGFAFSNVGNVNDPLATQELRQRAVPLAQRSYRAELAPIFCHARFRVDRGQTELLPIAKQQPAVRGAAQGVRLFQYRVEDRGLGCPAKR